MQPPAELRITQQEAVYLLHAVVHGVAKSNGIRALSIKGPFLGAQGLRPADYLPLDVDVWIEPARITELVASLREMGWAGGDFSTAPHLYPAHSTTLLHQMWPVELDLHKQFPGFLTQPEDAFESIWQARAEIDWCGTRVCVPNSAAHSLVMALHGLRDAGEGGSKGDLRQLVARVHSGFRADQIDEIASLATRLGCTQSAAPFLEQLGLEPTRMATVENPELRRAWEIRTSIRATAGTSWVVAIHESRGLPRLRMIGRAFWLDSDELRRQYPNIHLNRRGVLRAQVRRWVRLVHSLPVTALEYVRYLRIRNGSH